MLGDVLATGVRRSNSRKLRGWGFKGAKLSGHASNNLCELRRVATLQMASRSTEFTETERQGTLCSRAFYACSLENPDRGGSRILALNRTT
jgi:hypothetical protein